MRGSLSVRISGYCGGLPGRNTRKYDYDREGLVGDSIRARAGFLRLSVNRCGQSASTYREGRKLARERYEWVVFKFSTTTIITIKIQREMHSQVVVAGGLLFSANRSSFLSY